MSRRNRNNSSSIEGKYAHSPYNAPEFIRPKLNSARGVSRRGPSRGSPSRQRKRTPSKKKLEPLALETSENMMALAMEAMTKMAELHHEEKITHKMEFQNEKHVNDGRRKYFLRHRT